MTLQDGFLLPLRMNDPSLFGRSSQILMEEEGGKQGGENNFEHKRLMG